MLGVLGWSYEGCKDDFSGLFSWMGSWVGGFGLGIKDFIDDF